MSTPQAPLPQPQEQTLNQNRRVIYNTAVGLSIACPVVALLPPRKLDLFTLGLGVCWCLCVSHVVEERTGRGLMWHVGSALPGNRKKSGEGKPSIGDVQAEGRSNEAQRERGVVGRLWMGGEKDNWIEERAKREKEALEVGRGYGGLIMDQLKDVWSTRPFRARDEEGEGNATGLESEDDNDK